MGLSWKRALNRLIGDFFANQLGGYVRSDQTVIRFDRDGREIIEAEFFASERRWKIVLESSEEKPPLGRLRLLEGADEVFTGTPDALAFQKMAQLIRPQESSHAA